MSAFSVGSYQLNPSSKSDTPTFSSIESTSNPRAKERFSNFGDGACGEPLFPQRLLLDFTPDAEIDNEIVQKKICAFWECINNTPEIKNLMVKPQKYPSSKPPMTTEEAGSKSESEYSEDNVVDMGRTAISMLNIVEEKGLITRTFEAHMPQSQCTLGSREYKENEPDTQQKRMERSGSYVPIVCKCTSICTPCPVRKPKPTKEQKFWKEVKDWDALHPNDKLNGSTDDSSNPKPSETFSVFGDGSSGEPLCAQHLSIDFTPNAESDTNFVQKKEKILFTEGCKTDNASVTAKSEAKVKVENVGGDKTAVDMLKFAEEKNLIDRIFVAKMPQSKCTLGSREYKEAILTQPKKKEKKKHVCTSTTSSSMCPKRGAQNNRKSSGVQLSPIRILSRKLNEWDAQHPKSMDPPGHAPSLQHCTIQRQVFP